MRLTNAIRDLWNLYFRNSRVGAELLCMHLLPRHQLRLRDAAGWVVECCGGTVWITQQGDVRDILLKAGESFTLDRDGTTLVSGLCDAEAVITVRPPRTERGHRGLHGARDAAPLGGNARAVWMNALYPESGPWNDPASLRRAGLL